MTVPIVYRLPDGLYEDALAYRVPAVGEYIGLEDGIFVVMSVLHTYNEDWQVKKPVVRLARHYGETFW